MNTLWTDDQELFALCRRELFTSVVGDILDELGRRHQFLPPEIRALRPDFVVIGRAMTVLEADCPANSAGEGNNPLLCKPFGLMLEALDDLKTGEVYVCSGASPQYALLGELMVARARACGAVGAVLDGYHRDTTGILAQNFPTFSFGAYAQDQAPRGKVIDFRVPLEIGQVKIQPDDIIFGDIDGVCVVPRELEEETMRRALEKARGEKTVMKAIEGGMSAREAFAKFGIL